MNCGKCGFAEILPGTGMLKCQLTGEAKLGADECNTNDLRSLKEREQEVATNRNNVLGDLEALRNRLNNIYKRVDPAHVMAILTDTTKEDAEKITEAIKYLEEFI